MSNETIENFYGDEIKEKIPLEDGRIKIVVIVSGTEVEYHVTQEELDNAQRESN